MKKILYKEDINQIIKRLNEAYEADPKAIESLFNNRISCNDKIADHPTFIVSDTSTGPTLGILGILNGILADFTKERIAAMIDDETKSIKGFTLWKVS